MPISVLLVRFAWGSRIDGGITPERNQPGRCRSPAGVNFSDKAYVSKDQIPETLHNRLPGPTAAEAKSDYTDAEQCQTGRLRDAGLNFRHENFAVRITRI
jgi:hypothetical protein